MLVVISRTLDEVEKVAWICFLFLGPFLPFFPQYLTFSLPPDPQETLFCVSSFTYSRCKWLIQFKGFFLQTLAHLMNIWSMPQLTRQPHPNIISRRKTQTHIFNTWHCLGEGPMRESTPALALSWPWSPCTLVLGVTSSSWSREWSAGGSGRGWVTRSGWVGASGSSGLWSLPYVGALPRFLTHTAILLHIGCIFAPTFRCIFSRTFGGRYHVFSLTPVETESPWGSTASQAFTASECFWQLEISQALEYLRWEAFPGSLELGALGGQRTLGGLRLH